MKRADLCPPSADLFRSRGPFYVMDRPLPLARGPFSFIRTPSGLLCSLKLRMRTILYGPLLAALDIFVRTDLLSVMRGHLSFAR
jgi:hypothetical protein